MAAYNPAGNQIELFSENVKPTLASTFLEILTCFAEISRSSESNRSGSNTELREFTQFEEDCLMAHNKYRKMHNVSVLKLDLQLCKVAQDWANVRFKFLKKLFLLYLFF